MKNRTKRDILFYATLGLSVICILIFSLPDLKLSQDRMLHFLLSAIFPRLAVSLFLIVAMLTSGYAHSLAFPLKGFAKALLWSVPCFLVAVVNFPFSALISGTATLKRLDLLWFFIAKCFSIGLMEELFFRGLALPVLLKKLNKHRHGVLLSVILSSAFFSCMHLLNLFMGANVGATLLQLGYTFLIGCMFAVLFLKTDNLWLCVLIHTLFNVGGVIVTELGMGKFQDTVFWILTAIAGVICTLHILLSLRSVIQKHTDGNN
ncbi:MAG: CPBP family intramembrane metalloprotease [Clostridia bacterium]|nr:CPBP family intramembrane metalloprotease [Clostridia bacterium]